MLKILTKIPTVAYAAGFIGCAVISYILYPQSKSSRKSIKKGYPRGLINCKNECFINVILQSLAASEKVTNWLMQNKSTSLSSTNLFDTLAMIIMRINRLDSGEAAAQIDNNNNNSNDQDEFYAAQSFKAALSAHNWIIQSEEHDCHELFHLIMDVLDEEQLETKKSLTSLNFFQAASHLKENSRLKSKNPFHGFLVSQLQCLDCNYKYPLRLESFYSLSLVLPPHKAVQHLTLVELFQNYFKTEQITDMKCENCSTTSKKGFIKKLAIAKLPDTLCLQIQRNSWSGLNDEMIKQSNYIQFPLNIKIDNKINELNNNNNHVYNNNSNNNNGNKKSLNDLNGSLLSSSSSAFSLKQLGLGGLLGGNKTTTKNKVAVKPQTNTNEILPNHHQYYELRSAIVHYGNAVSGHFVSFRQSLNNDNNTTMEKLKKLDDNNNNWLQISDSDIKTCKQYHLLSSNVYMLFYDKVIS